MQGVLPKHIAVIMDGNGRWAKKRGLNRVFGHRNGVQAVHETMEAAVELGIPFVTFYAFSTENWNRPQEEISALTGLLLKTIDQETPTLMEHQVRLLTIGDSGRFGPEVTAKLDELKAKTAGNTGTTVLLALNYSGKWDLVQAARRMALDAVAGRLEPHTIDESVFATYLSTAGIPDPDLLIRTSGEYRISNFLLWQLAYAEFYFTPVLWPDFRKTHLFEAIADFQQRERRFGMTGDQLTDKQQ